MSDEKYESWAIVEVMGHKRFAGYVSEQVIAGSALVRVDVPETTHEKQAYSWDTGKNEGTAETKPAYTKLIGVSSIYCITPTTEDIARRAAQEIERYNDPIPVDLPKILPRSAEAAPVEDAVLDDDDDPAFDDVDDSGHAPPCWASEPGKESDESLCNLPEGHEGDHERRDADGESVVARWPQ